MLVVIQWRFGITEYIRFDENELPSAGSEITTTEYWPDLRKSFDYVVTCQASDESPCGTVTFTLQYDQEKNPDHPNIAWGTSTLKIEKWRSKENRKATAEFRCPTLNEYTGDAAACEVIDELVFADLSTETIERLARPKQWEMRKHLLQEDGACAISGETTAQALEAAHINGHENNGSTAARNGILLRADLHRLFDRGILLIAEDGSLSLRPDVDIGEEYRDLIAAKKRLSPTVFGRIEEALKQRSTRAP